MSAFPRPRMGRGYAGLRAERTSRSWRGAATQRHASTPLQAALAPDGASFAILSPKGARASGCAEAPAGERGITPANRSNGRRPVHGCSDHTSVAAWLSFANDRRGATRNSPISACGAGRRRRGSHLAVYREGTPSFDAGPVVPAPSVLAGHGTRRLRAPAIKRRRRTRAQPPTAPVAGGRITDMVTIVKECVMARPGDLWRIVPNRTHHPLANEISYQVPLIRTHGPVGAVRWT